EEVIVERGDTCRCKVEQKTVEHQVVKPAPRLGEVFIWIITARPATLHVGETERILRCATERVKVDYLGEPAFSLAPEADRANRKDHQTIKRDYERRHGHRHIG